MRLQDLIDLFLRDDDVLRPQTFQHQGFQEQDFQQNDEVVARDREDNSSLADIVRILREHDGQYEPDRR